MEVQGGLRVLSAGATRAIEAYSVHPGIPGGASAGASGRRAIDDGTRIRQRTSPVWDKFRVVE